jgi:WS/DGAT/MGAT family acyltransferase
MGLKQLSPVDGQFISAESRKTPEHIGVLSIYDPSTARGKFVRFKDILRHFETRIDDAPIFTQRLKKVPLDLDQPYWVDAEDFDLEHHVRHIALPKPGDWRQLCIQIARLHSQSMDFDRPLWNAYIIEGLDKIKSVPKGSFAMYLKMHHAAVDGMAGAEFIQAIHDLTPIFPDGEYGDRRLYHRAVPNPPSSGKLLLNSYVRSWRQPLRMARLGADILPHKFRDMRFRHKNKLEAPPNKPTTRFDTPITPNRVFNALEFPLTEVKEIRSALPGVTVNDLAIAIVSRALRLYLSEKHELPLNSLLAMVPVSLRDKEAAKKGGNSISIVSVPIHTEEGDPLELLKKVNETMGLAKLQRTEVGEPFIMGLVRSVPSMAQTGINRLMNVSTKMGVDITPANTTISNVAGSPVPIYLAGAKAVKFHGIGFLQHGFGLFNAITSYNGELCISFLACREQMPDPESYHAALKKAYGDIYKAAKKAGK